MIAVELYIVPRNKYHKETEKDTCYMYEKVKRETKGPLHPHNQFLRTPPHNPTQTFSNFTNYQRSFLTIHFNGSHMLLVYLFSLFVEVSNSTQTLLEKEKDKNN